MKTKSFCILALTGAFAALLSSAAFAADNWKFETRQGNVNTEHWIIGSSPNSTLSFYCDGSSWRMLFEAPDVKNAAVLEQFSGPGMLAKFDRGGKLAFPLSIGLISGEMLALQGSTSAAEVNSLRGLAGNIIISFINGNDKSMGTAEFEAKGFKGAAAKLISNCPKG